MNDFDQSIFWPEFKAAGMLSVATIGGVDVDVGFAMPDQDLLGRGVLSREYEIEYQHADAPTLDEGDSVVIDGVSYIVRESPQISPGGNAADGYFRTALLTKV